MYHERRIFFSAITQLATHELLFSTILLVQVSRFISLPFLMLGLRLARVVSLFHVIRKEKEFSMHDLFMSLFPKRLSTIMCRIYILMLQNCYNELNFLNSNELMWILKEPTSTRLNIWAKTCSVTNAVYLLSDQPYFNKTMRLQLSCMPLPVFRRYGRLERKEIRKWLRFFWVPISTMSCTGILFTSNLWIKKYTLRKSTLKGFSTFFYWRIWRRWAGWCIKNMYHPAWYTNVLQSNGLLVKRLRVNH